MLKLIHGADFHLDSPFSGLAPQQAARRRGEQRRLLEDLARVTWEKQADLVLLSGDLFDSHTIYQETAQALCQALGSMNCPVFLAPGNHDYYHSASPYASLDWPDNVHIFTEETPEQVLLPDLGCAVWGCAFTGPHRDTSPLAQLQTRHRPGLIQLMAVHGDLAPNSLYGPITQEEMAASGLDYIALGHVHQYSGLNQAGPTLWAYPGCLEGRGFDETGDKGVLYLELEEGSRRAHFIPLARHRYADLTVDLTDTAPLAALTACLPADTREDIYRITFTGQCAAPDLHRLTRDLADQFYGLTLRDRTCVPRDLWDRAEEDSLTGLFLSRMRQLCAEDPDNMTLQQAARFGLAALEHGEDPYL